MSGPEERVSVGVLAVVVLGVMWDGPPREWSVAAVMSSVGQKLSWPFPASSICRKSLLLRCNYGIQSEVEYSSIINMSRWNTILSVNGMRIHGSTTHTHLAS